MYHVLCVMFHFHVSFLVQLFLVQVLCNWLHVCVCPLSNRAMHLYIFDEGKKQYSSNNLSFVHQIHFSRLGNLFLEEGTL